MRLDGARGNSETRGDLLVAQSVGEQGEDLTLAMRQRGPIGDDARLRVAQRSAAGRRPRDQHEVDVRRSIGGGLDDRDDVESPVVAEGRSQLACGFLGCGDDRDACHVGADVRRLAWRERAR
jgi:hypothetical protein